MAESAPASLVDLQALVDLFTVASYKAEGHATGTHSGVAAVLEALSEAAQRSMAVRFHPHSKMSIRRTRWDRWRSLQTGPRPRTHGKPKHVATGSAAQGLLG